MMLWCSIQEIRRRKSSMVMEALCAGWREGAQCIDGDPPADGNPFAIYGQTWGAERLLPDAIKSGRLFYQIDNGYWRPGRGSPEGYYRICYRGLSPVFLADADARRAEATGVRMQPWRKSGKHILLAMPGGDFGTAIGLSMVDWSKSIKTKIRQFTDRPIIVRDRDCRVRLDAQLVDCWALVTHSSNVAVEAVIAGVPVFVADTSAALPVGNPNLMKIERPAMPDNRDAWWRSLMCQQFTVAEMTDGTAFDHMALVREQVDIRAAA